MGSRGRMGQIWDDYYGWIPAKPRKIAKAKPASAPARVWDSYYGWVPAKSLRVTKPKGSSPAARSFPVVKVALPASSLTDEELASGRVTSREEVTRRIKSDLGSHCKDEQANAVFDALRGDGRIFYDPKVGLRIRSDVDLIEAASNWLLAQHGSGKRSPQKRKAVQVVPVGKKKRRGRRIGRARLKSLYAKLPSVARSGVRADLPKARHVRSSVQSVPRPSAGRVAVVKPTAQRATARTGKFDSNSLVRCPYCDATVRTDRMSRHLARVHATGKRSSKMQKQKTSGTAAREAAERAARKRHNSLQARLARWLKNPSPTAPMPRSEMTRKAQPKVKHASTVGRNRAPVARIWSGGGIETNRKKH